MISTRTALYLLCCVLHIFKSKDLASTVAATLFYPPESFCRKTLGEALETEMPNGCCSCSVQYQVDMESSSQSLPDHTATSNGASKITLRYS